MDFSECAERFWDDGYLVLDSFFNPELMGELNDLIKQHFGADPDFWHTDEFLSESRTEVIPWFPQNDGPSAFDQVDHHEALQCLTTALLGQGWRSDYCMVMYSKKGTSGQAWHQDCTPDDPACHNMNRLIYTSDITESVGGQTVVVPGSHKRGLLPAGDPLGQFDEQVVITPKQGTLVMLHGHTWHRVLPIVGDCRYSTNFRALPAQAPNDVTDICIYRNMRYQFSTSRIVETR